MPEDAYPQPPSPLRCAPRSVDPSIISRWSARPWKAEQGSSDDRREGGVAWPRIPPYPPIRKLQADLHIPGILVVGVSALMRAAGAIQSAYLSAGSKQYSLQRVVRSMKLATTSSTCGAARQKPGRVVVRDFCNWLFVLQRVQTKPAASHSPGRPATRGGDDATTRQIARRFGHCKARNSANARRAREGDRRHSCSAASRLRRRSRFLVEAAPHLAGAIISAAT